MSGAVITLGSGEAVGGLLLAIYAICGFALICAWIVFPFVVISRLGALRRQLERNGDLLEEIAAQGRTRPVKDSSVRYE